MKRLLNIMTALLVVCLLSGCKTHDSSEGETTNEVKELFRGFYEPCIQWNFTAEDVEDYMDEADLDFNEGPNGIYISNGAHYEHFYFFVREAETNARELCLVGVSFQKESFPDLLENFKKVYEYRGQSSVGWQIFTDKEKGITIRVENDNMVEYFPYMNGETAAAINDSIEGYLTKHHM